METKQAAIVSKRMTVKFSYFLFGFISGVLSFITILIVQLGD